MSRGSETPIEALLRERLMRAGRLTFAEFMELVLYEPELGYYATQAVLGAEGDYVTSPELHPAFGALLGRQLEECWRALGRPEGIRVREVGGGSGALCRDLLLWAKSAAPDFAEAIEYEIHERNAALRTRQLRTLERAGLATAAVTWSGIKGTHESAGAELPASPTPLVGCVVSNELLDSFPVHLVTVRDGRLLERYVALSGAGLAFEEDDPSSAELEAYFAKLGFLPGDGCVAEVNLQALCWMAEAAACLGRGLMLTIDYGYLARDLYSPERRYGTLLCYFRHTLNSDPLTRVGRQDITSHVDFTSLALVGEEHGLSTIALLSQARSLRNLGLPAYLERMHALAASEREANQRALRALVDPEGLGRVGFLWQARGMDEYVPAAVREDAPPPASSYLPRLAPDALRLPGPEDLAEQHDFMEMWRDFLAGAGREHDA